MTPRQYLLLKVFFSLHSLHTACIKNAQKWITLLTVNFTRDTYLLFSCAVFRQPLQCWVCFPPVPIKFVGQFHCCHFTEEKWFTFGLALIFKMENGIVSQHWSRRPPSLSLPFIHIYENAVYDSYTVLYICHTLHGLFSVFSPPRLPPL